MSKCNKFYIGDSQFNRLSGRPGVRVGEKGFSPAQKDYARLLHSPSFRRLQNKTQLFPGHESDFFRNRLTHSLEVAQIAKGIVRKINSDNDLGDSFIDENIVDFAAIAHDLGHPPFGHNGEYALNELMSGCGGFEGNAQTLRILSHIESRMVGDDDKNFGLDLTYRSLASVLKYDNLIPINSSGKNIVKGYYETEKNIVEQIKQSLNHDNSKKLKTIECSIMDIADDIAYSTYDLEDSLKAEFTSPMLFLNAIIHGGDLKSRVINKVNSALKCYGFFDCDDIEALEVLVQVFGGGYPSQVENNGKLDPEIVSAMAGLSYWKIDREYQKNKKVRSRFTAERVGNLVDSVSLRYNEDCPYLSEVHLDRSALLRVEILKHLNYELVIRSPRLAIVEHRGKSIINQIFGAFIDSCGDLLPDDWRIEFKNAPDECSRKRVVCDYIAGMTDRYAVEVYNRLFDEGVSLYKPL